MTSEIMKTNLSLRAPLYMEHLDGPFSLAALPYTQMNELLSRSGDRMYSRPHDPPPPPPSMHPLGEIKPPSVIRWDTPQNTTHKLRFYFIYWNLHVFDTGRNNIQG